MPSKRTIVMPTDEEDEAINRGIAEDPDTFDVSAEQMQKMRPLGKLNSTKELVTILYDAEVLEAFRASGDGWQTRMNDALKEWLQSHRP